MVERRPCLINRFGRCFWPPFCQIFRAAFTPPCYAPPRPYLLSLLFNSRISTFLISELALLILLRSTYVPSHLQPPHSITPELIACRTPRRPYRSTKTRPSCRKQDGTLGEILQANGNRAGRFEPYPTSLHGQQRESAELDQEPLVPVRRCCNYRFVDRRMLIKIGRYYEFTGKEPVITLKGISIYVLFVFFDWLLSVRKDRLGAASTLQTYWNVFCLVRKKETGYLEINPLIKSQIHGVWEPHSALLLGWRLLYPTTTGSEAWVKNGEEEEAHHAGRGRVRAPEDTVSLCRNHVRSRAAPRTAGLNHASSGDYG